MLLKCYGYLIFYMKWVYYFILFLNLSVHLKNSFHRHHQELHPGEKMWTKHYSSFLNFSFNCLCPKLETSWHVPWWLQPIGLWEVSQGVSESPKQTATGSAGAELRSRANSQPFLGKRCRWWFTSLGKENLCQWTCERNGSCCRKS